MLSQVSQCQFSGRKIKMNEYTEILRQNKQAISKTILTQELEKFQAGVAEYLRPESYCVLEVISSNEAVFQIGFLGEPEERKEHILLRAYYVKENFPVTLTTFGKKYENILDLRIALKDFLKEDFVVRLLAKYL